MLHTWMFLNDFGGVFQSARNQKRVFCTLLQNIDQVLRLIDDLYHYTLQEPVSPKNIQQGDTPWGTIKLVLVWIINTTTMIMN